MEPEFHQIISDRIEMLSWDAECCWRELERHCEQYQSVASPSDAHLARGRRIVEALARCDVSEQRLLDLLARQVDPRADTPMKWMEPLLVHLAGRLRLKTAIPLLVEKMRLDDDVLLPECEAALVRIGGDAAVRAVATAFVGSERRFRSAAAGVLECVHTDLAVRSALELLPREADDYVARRLRWALLGQFTSEAIEPARQWLLERGFADLEDRGLRNHLLRVCEVLGETFPEYDEWSRNSEADERERLHALEQLKDDPVRSILWAMEQLTGKKTAEVIQEIEQEQAVRAVDAVVEKASRPAQARVGRNDPCPCGSGKKYKKCCLRNR